MAEKLYGAPVAEELRTRTMEYTEPLKLRPVLAIFRTGADADDVSYERSLRAACSKCGEDVWTAELPAFAPQDALVRAVHRIGRDKDVDGVIVMCPRQYDRGLIAAAIGRGKDVDGAGYEEGGAFVPCTAQAVMETLDFYGVEPAGKNVVVIGRSAVSGAPAAALLTERGARVTVCHTGTDEPEKLCRQADILVCTAGKAGLVDAERMKAGQVIIDVGINVAPDGSVCGDVIAADAERIAAAYTPVPRGVGAVTPYVLALHVAQAAAERKKL